MLLHITMPLQMLFTPLSTWATLIHPWKPVIISLSSFIHPPATRLSYTYIFLCVLSKSYIFTCIRTCIHWTLFGTWLSLLLSIVYQILSKVLNTFNKLKLSEILEPPLWGNVMSMTLIPGLHFSLNAKYWWVSPLTSRKPQGQIPQKHKLPYLTINLAPQIYFSLSWAYLRNTLLEGNIQESACPSTCPFLFLSMFITRKIKVLTFSTEDPAQILPYLMAGKPQLMVLQREEKAPTMYPCLSSWESKAPVQWISFLRF